MIMMIKEIKFLHGILMALMSYGPMMILIMLLRILIVIMFFMNIFVMKKEI